MNALLNVVIQPSYIHPDEHFQTLEVLSTIFLNTTKSNLPWEFTNEFAARSYVPLYIFYGPLYYISTVLLNITDPFIILKFVRLQNIILYLIALNYTIPKRDSRDVKYWLLTSYVTWCIQSHSFSNSIETIVLLLLLKQFNDLVKSSKNGYKKSAYAGSLIAFGLFNRMTFPAFIMFPCLYMLLKYYTKYLKQLVLMLVVFSITSTCFILLDTSIYDSDKNWVIAPLNNMFYNLDESNLAKHGLHPRYNHVLINLPLLLGPFIFPFIISMILQFSFKSLNVYFLSVLSGLSILSIFKHQELRFLIPLLPVICISVTRPFTESKFSPAIFLRSNIFIWGWVAFNVFLGSIMGIYHQSGIVKVLQEFYKKKDRENMGVHIWWKTYSPPTWMYGNLELTTSTTNFLINVDSKNDQEHVDNVDFKIIDNHVVDLKGCDRKLLNLTISKFLESTDSVLLIAPDAFELDLYMLCMFEYHYEVDKIFQTLAHLDLDHLNDGYWKFSRSNIGIGIYNISYPKIL